MADGAKGRMRRDVSRCSMAAGVSVSSAVWALLVSGVNLMFSAIDFYVCHSVCYLLVEVRETCV